MLRHKRSSAAELHSVQEERLLRERPQQLDKLIEEEAEAVATCTAQAQTATSKLAALEVHKHCIV